MSLDSLAESPVLVGSGGCKVATKPAAGLSIFAASGSNARLAPDSNNGNADVEGAGLSAPS